MKYQEIIKKVDLGYSPLTNTVFFFIADKDGYAKYKRQLKKEEVSKIVETLGGVLENMKDD